MRVQNEGTGKRYAALAPLSVIRLSNRICPRGSSWWIINPDAKPGKAARRRATSMETQKYEKKRGRVKKKVEALRAGGISGVVHENTSPSSSVSEGLDAFPESPLDRQSSHGPSFTLSPMAEAFRPRASSNASSCGRMSPIPSTLETDMHDREAPPLSPSTWDRYAVVPLYEILISCASHFTSLHLSPRLVSYMCNSTIRGLSMYNTSDVAGDPYTDQQLVDMANTMKLGTYGLGNCVSSKSSPSSALVNGGQTSPPGVTLAPLYNGYTNGVAVSTATGGTLSRNGSDPYFKAAGLENNVTLSKRYQLAAASLTDPLCSPSLSHSLPLRAASLSTARSPSRASSMLSSAGSDGLTPNTVFSLSPAQSMDTLQSTHANSGNYHYTSPPQQPQQPSNCMVPNSLITSLSATASHVVGHLFSINNQVI